MAIAPDLVATDTISCIDVSELAKLARIADQLEAAHIAKDARALAERLSEGRFYVACFGQFKRGKSTLLDALIGEPLLPTGVVPVTSVPTVIRHGQTRSARVLAEGSWQPIPVEAIAEYVSEEHNPENAKHVEGVEVFLPSDLLRDGMCLVDTPGIGSVFEGNTAATQALIPHVDAAVIVVGTDPPISGDELALVNDVAEHVKDFLIVLNKADRSASEDRNAAAAFTRKTLQERLRVSVGEIYEASSLQQLTTRNADFDWNALVRRLEEISEKSGRRLLRTAMQRGTRLVRTSLLATIREGRDALLRPLGESEARLSVLQRIISDAQQSLSDLGYLLNGVQQRVSAAMAKRRDVFLQHSRTEAAEQYRTKLAVVRKQFGPAYRRVVLDAADEVARGLVMPWLHTEQAFAEEAYKKTTARFIDLVNEFLKRVSEGGGIGSGLELLEYEERLNAPSKFQFEDFISIRRPASPGRYLGDVILSMFGYMAPIQKAGYEFLDRLLETNSSRIQNDLEQRLVGSRRKLEREIRHYLSEAISISERSMERARELRFQGQQIVEAELRMLASFESDLQQAASEPGA